LSEEHIDGYLADPMFRKRDPRLADAAATSLDTPMSQDRQRARSASCGQRLGIVEPVFANIRSTHRPNRFNHRGRRRVTTQWQLSCMAHNIGKMQRFAAQ
jgi:hypothetical protein